MEINKRGISDKFVILDSIGNTEDMLVPISNEGNPVLIQSDENPSRYDVYVVYDLNKVLEHIPVPVSGLCRTLVNEMGQYYRSIHELDGIFLPQPDICLAYHQLLKVNNEGNNWLAIRYERMNISDTAFLNIQYFSIPFDLVKEAGDNLKNIKEVCKDIFTKPNKSLTINLYTPATDSSFKGLSEAVYTDKEAALTEMLEYMFDLIKGK